MPTLAPKLPYTHPFAGGFPYRGSQRLPSDPDALTYLAAVAAADGAPVEVGVATAVDDFFKGCKADGTFSALKASCILCGARTLAGALVPLAGTAPTNNNFVDADYNRETGLKGNGSTKYLDSNRASGPQDNEHLSIYQTSVTTGSSKAIAGAGLSQDGVSYFFNISTTNIGFRQQTTSFDTITGGNAVGFVGMSRSSSLGYSASAGGSSQDFTQASQTLFSANHSIFTATTNTSYSDARLAFYSIGESISDLALLDARVTALVQRIQLSLSTGLDVSGYDDATVAYLLAAYNNGATLA